MFRILSFIAVILIVCCGQARAEDQACVLKSKIPGIDQAYMPFPAALKHGVNIAHWWEDDQDNIPSKDEIRMMHNMGFDFVRLPLSPSWLEMKDRGEQAQKLAQLHCDIITLLNEGLTVVIDLQPSDDYKTHLFEHPEQIIRHLEKLWGQMQPVIGDLPSWRVYLEILDDPLMESVAWWGLQEKIIEDLRTTYTGNTFVASSGPFNGWWDLSDKKPYKDPNVVYDFHFYEPLVFTHHAAEWLHPDDPDKPPSPIVYPVDKRFDFDLNDPDIKKYVDQEWNRASLSVVLKQAATWRDHENALIVCLEFGVYRANVDKQSRYNWLRDAHELMDDMNIPWALWEYRGPFGLIDANDILDVGMLEALNLRHTGLR